MRYCAMLKDGLLTTDNYEDEELRLLRDNLVEDFSKLGIDYTVDVFELESKKKVMSLVPVPDGK